MDKIFKVNKKLKYVLVIITIISLITGVLFIKILKNNDLSASIGALDEFIDNVSNNTLDYYLSLRSSLSTNILYVLLIWFLGVSIIGIPIILFIYFIKVFSIGFSLSVIVYKFGLKGLLYGFIYIFPHNILNIFIFLILSIKSISYSFNFTEKYFKKDKIDFSIDRVGHKKILLISIIGVILTSLYGTYLMPYLFKILLKFM